jgi:hypothetical protein
MSKPYVIIMQAKVFQESSSLDNANDMSELQSAQQSTNLSQSVSEAISDAPKVHNRPPSTLLEEWFRSASRAARGGQGIVARFSGFSMPTPSQLLPPSLGQPLWSAFGLRGRGSQTLAGVDPDAAAALRRAVEGSVLQRSAGAHRSNPDLVTFAHSTQAPEIKVASDGARTPQLRLRLQELRNKEGNNCCRNVQVTSARAENSQSSFLLTQPQSMLSSLDTSPLSQRDHHLPVAGNNTGSNRHDLHAEVQLSHTYEHSAHSLPASLLQQSAGEISCIRSTSGRCQEMASKTSAACMQQMYCFLSTGRRVAQLNHMCTQKCLAVQSAFEQDSPARSVSVAAQPVGVELSDQDVSTSGASTDRSLVQANCNKWHNTGSGSEVCCAHRAPDTLTITAASATEHSQTKLSYTDACDVLEPARVDRAERAKQDPATSTDTPIRNRSSGVNMHVEKPPLDGLSTGERKQVMQESAAQSDHSTWQQVSEKQPLVFLHGVGFGVLPYLGWVWKLLTAFPGVL